MMMLMFTTLGVCTGSSDKVVVVWCIAHVGDGGIDVVAMVT